MNLNQQMFENQWTSTISTETDRDEENDSYESRKCAAAAITKHNCLHKHTQCYLRWERRPGERRGRMAHVERKKKINNELVKSLKEYFPTFQ